MTSRKMKRYEIVNNCVYVLRLEDDCYYVGITDDFERRFLEHNSNAKGAIWTRLHKPLGVVEIQDIPCRDGRYERDMTIKYMSLYGIDKVRGYSFASDVITPSRMKTACKLIEEYKQDQNSTSSRLTTCFASPIGTE
jgi:predicted GIY-YIG superfamily endonuclease